MGMMKELLDKRLEENKWEMWKLLNRYMVSEPGEDETDLTYDVRAVLDKITRLPEVTPCPGEK